MPEERRLRRRIPVSNRKFRPAQPSPWPRRRSPSATRQLSKKPSRPIEILQRCNSEPTLRTDDDNRNLTTPPDSVLFRPMTCTDVFSSADYLPLLQSPQKFEASNPSPGLKKDGWEQAKMGDLLAWLLFFFVLIIIIVIVVYQLMCLADLEFDYINPYDSASRINKMIMPEFITQGVLCFLYLITGHWFMSLLSVPYLYYNVRVYMLRQHLVDVTEIFNSLHWEKKRRFFKLGYLVFLLCISLFWTIWNALEEEEQAF